MKFALLLAVSMASATAFAIPQAPKLLNPLVRSTSGEAVDPTLFEGIVKFSNCSGSVVSFKGAPLANKAIVMTNGHCHPKLKLNEVIINKPATGRVSVFDASMKLHKLNLVKTIYASMNQTDVTFYEADKTYKEILEQYDVEALELDNSITAIPESIHVISGYWEILTSCEAEAIVPFLKEDKWTWVNSIRYSKDCMTKGGYSGSPVIAQNTRTVVGIHNTGNNGKFDCSDMNPCEQNEAGEVIFNIPNRRYAQQVFQFYKCLNEKHEIDVTVAGCDVAKP